MVSTENADTRFRTVFMAHPLQLAAIIYDNDSQPVDALLHSLANHYNRKGIRVAGLAMALNEQGLRREPMAVQDVETGTEYSIAQTLGKESQSCCLDPSGLADATGVLRAAVHNPPKLAIVNRFGQQEIDGRGCRAEFVQLLDAGIPVLTVVKRKFLKQWHEFGGEEAVDLVFSEAPVQQWCDGLLKR
ncbi:MAG: nucleoside-triphosphatase THEP1 [Pseudomonadales bacterium]